MTETVTREQILNAIRTAVEPLPAALSMYEGGSAAFDRLDELSDIDLGIDVEDGAEEAVFEALEARLEALSPIVARWVLPQPTWHGMSQRFYRLQGAGEHLMVDLCLRPLSRAESFSERERHGVPIVYFDKRELVKARPMDRAALRAKLRERLEQLREQLPFTASLPGKELQRGRITDAFHFYVGLNLRPLVEVLRIRYCPFRYDYGMRYLEFDLPATVATKVQELCLAGDREDLAAKHDRCRRWLEQELRDLDPDLIELPV